MRLVLFGIQDFEKAIYEKHNSDAFNYQLDFHLGSFTSDKTAALANAAAISIFANNPLDRKLLTLIREQGIRLVLCRSTGYDHVDLACAKELGITVMNVPAYSPPSVAEHAVALLLTLYRKMPLLQQRLETNNFELNGNLGESVYDKTVGVIGVGDIGSAFANIMKGFGCRVIGYDPVISQLKPDFLDWVELEELWQQSDIISLHCPLNESTHHLINNDSLSKMKKGVTIINTARGPIIKTEDFIEAINNQTVRYAGLDVYEFEKGLFFKSHHGSIKDPSFNLLKGLSNVVITPHVAFYTNDSITNIAYTTLLNAKNFRAHAHKAANVVG